MTPGTPLFARAVLCSLILFAVEQVGFQLSYASGFLAEPTDRLSFAWLGLALAWILALLVAGGAWLVADAQRWLRARPRLADARYGLVLQCIALISLSASVLLAQDGKLLRLPASWHLAIPVMLTLGFGLAARWLQRSVAGERYNVFACCSLLLVVYYLFDYETLALFQRADFGLSDPTRRLRTLTVIGMVTALLGFGSACARWSGEVVSARGPLLGAGVLVLVLFALHFVNLNAFVDLHPQIHAALLLLSVRSSWQLAGRWRWSGVSLRLAAALTALAGATVALTGPHSVARYVATEHTVSARFALEHIHETLLSPGRRAGEWTRMARRTAMVLGGRPLPAAPARANPPELVVPRHPPGTHRATPRGAVIFFLDTKRVHDIGPTAGGRSKTPRIDQCFRDGIRFERALTASTRTLTSFPSLYTGTYAATRNQERPDLAEIPHWFATARDANLVDALDAAGFHTKALTNAYYTRFLSNTDKQPLFGRFDEIAVADEALGQNPGLLAALAADAQLVPDAGRFLFVVHLMSHEVDDLSGIDAVVGTVCERLQAKGALNDTALVLTADHGIQFREHGRTTYGRTLFDEELVVPLLWRVPGLPARRVKDAVSSVDLLPTLLELLQVRVAFPVEGRSYLSALRGEPLDRQRPIFFEVRSHQFPQVGVEVDRLKLIRWTRSGAEALFRVDTDPHERHSLTGHTAYQERLKQLDALLDRFLRARGEAG